jgi:hypothetical protein
MSISDQGDKPKGKVGRPTAYKPEYDEQVEKLARMGATDEEIIEFFNVCMQTLFTWKAKHPEFLEAIKRGKVESDMKVAQSLYDRALGGDTTAQIFWLKNRRSKGWRDTRDVNQTNEDGPNRTKAVADENRRVRELLERLGSAATPHRPGAAEEPEGAEFISVLCENNRRSGRTS